jgi:hypothetical protein
MATLFENQVPLVKVEETFRTKSDSLFDQPTDIKPNICCAGPNLYIYYDLSKKNFITICDLMGCTPEPISEGGFQYVGVTGLKTIRLQTDYPKPISRKNFMPTRTVWPWIGEKTYEEWRNSSETILSGNQIVTTTLNSFYGAPSFTLEELEKWKTVLAKYSIIVQSMPSAAMLKGG